MEFRGDSIARDDGPTFLTLFGLMLLEGGVAIESIIVGEGEDEGVTVEEVEVMESFAGCSCDLRLVLLRDFKGVMLSFVSSMSSSCDDSKEDSNDKFITASCLE
jgi:hypothetical protein